MRRHQGGVALIVVLLIIAIITVIATNITSRNQLAVQRTLNLVEYDQAYWYAMSAEQLLKKVLKKDLDDSEGRVYFQQNWAMSDVVFPAEHGEIGGKVTDMRSCFNLNALAQSTATTNQQSPDKLPTAAVQFKSLLMALGMDDFAAERLTQTVKDYVDSDSLVSAFGAEDAEYEARPIPYRAANTLLIDKSELRSVIGVTQKVYQKLAPYICVIPGNDKQLLNVNTISVEQPALLAGMLENKITVGEAETIINQRPGNGYESVDEFWKDNSASLGSINDSIKSSFTVKSNYFLLHAGAKVNQAIFQMECVLKRTQGNSMNVIARQFGVQNSDQSLVKSPKDPSGEKV